MITFEELRVTNDANYLIIKAKVREESYYDNVYIESVRVQTEESYPDGNFDYYYKATDSPSESEDTTTGPKEVSLIISRNSLLTPIDKHLLFVTVETGGIPAPDTPCGMDTKIVLGITMWKGNIYNNFINYFNELNNNKCSIPTGLIDYFLRFKALSTYIDTGHIDKAKEFYQKMFLKNNEMYSPSRCGCNG